LLDYKDIIERYKNDLFQLEHVVGIGFGKKEKNGKRLDEEAIIVLVDKKVPEQSLQSKNVIPREMENYKTDVIEIGEIQFQDLRTEKMRPAQPGISIGHYKISAGTFGAVVKDKKTGQPMILSNNHVLANISNGKDGRSKKGDPILQPGSYDKGKRPGDVIGYLERFVPIDRKDGGNICPIARAAGKITNAIIKVFKPDYTIKFVKKAEDNLVDCALARPADNSLIKSDILGIGNVTGNTEPEPGMKVRKSGRTTGVTSGNVRVVGATVEVQLSQEESAIFTDQFITEPMSESGDSGSLVVDKDNQAVGLLFAGSKKATICNKINTVFEKLSIEI